MRHHLVQIFKISGPVLVTLAIIFTLLRFNPLIFPDIPEPSPAFDCDDSTLAMYRHFQRYGIEATPIIGNLDSCGETYQECNHVWLLVACGDRYIAYDWGTPRFDRQHYEGYPISLDFLLYAVAEDRRDMDFPIVAKN